MRKYIKSQTISILNTLIKANRSIKDVLKSGNAEALSTLLTDCQEAAISVGNSIEQSEGEGTEAVRYLEEYCEALYLISTGNKDAASNLDNCIRECVSRVSDFKETREVVFLPYKASMWDSLEAVYLKEKEDPDCTALVVPIPYYDKNPDGSFKERHYEINEYPENIEVIPFDRYDFENRHPDEIYIHNPYDEWNLITSVEPYFYTPNLKKMTDKLVYIPYFVLADVTDPDNEDYLKGIEHFVTVPGVVNSDEVRVQSKEMARAYINILVRMFREAGNKERANRNYWEKRIIGAGSPKFDKILEAVKKEYELPEEWEKLTKKPDGSKKKIILYNTSVGALLKEDEKMTDKIRRALEIFYENRDSVVLWWRPHPLIRATIESMRPKLWEDYSSIVEDYKKAGWGIYDDTPDMDRALAMADAYYGDHSSLVQLCQKIEMPIMIQNVEV